MDVYSPEQGMKFLREASAIANANRNDPQGAARRIGDIADLAAAAVECIPRDEAPTRFVVPVSTPSVTLSTTGSTETADVEVRFPSNGWLLGITGLVMEDTTLAGSVSFKLQWNGVSTMITNGYVDSYLPIAALTNPLATQLNYFKYRRRVSSDEKITVKYKSERPALALLSADIVMTPKLVFLVKEDVPGGSYGV